MGNDKVMDYVRALDPCAVDMEGLSLCDRLRLALNGDEEDDEDSPHESARSDCGSRGSEFPIAFVEEIAVQATELLRQDPLLRPSAASLLLRPCAEVLLSTVLEETKAINPSNSPQRGPRWATAL